MKIDLRNQRPKVEKLPDGRLRATFVYDVLEQVGRTQAELTAEVWLAWGTVAPVDFTGLRLVKQDLDGTAPNKNGSLPLVRVYEELPATAEIQVGANAYSYPEDGGKTTVAEFIQFTAGTYAPGTVGTSTAPGDATSYLQNEDATSDGTLRRIKRTYTDTGELSVTNETKNNGALLMRTIVSVKTVPSTPGGYTLISTAVKNTQGLPTYTYTFAKGTGEISRSVDYSQSINGGVTGLTGTTIRYLVAPSFPMLPATLSGAVAVGRDYAEQDGHGIWTTTWASGTGTVSTQDETKNNGALLLRTIRALGSAPDTPSGYTPISTDEAFQDGFAVYTKTFAKGTGEISRSVDYAQSDDQGTTGVTRTNIRYLTTDSVSADPTTLSGSVKISQDMAEQNGHRIWTIGYAKGTGTVVENIDIKEGGALTLYHRVGLNAIPSTPGGGNGALTTIIVTNGGSGYTSVPTVSITGGGGSGATATAVISGGAITSLTVSSSGTGYTSAPTVSFSGGAGSGGAATAVLATRAVSSIAVSAAGSGYTAAPTVTLTGGSGTGGAAAAVLTATTLASIALTNAGTGYTSAPTVSFSGGGGSGATATVTILAGGVTGLTLTNAGTGYTSAPTLSFSGGGGSGATATAALTGTSVASASVSAGGSGYTSAPTVSVSGGAGASAAITAVLTATTLASITVTAAGTGYTSAPTVSITGGGGTGGTATAVLTGRTVASITVTNAGSGYTTVPTISFSGGGGIGAAATVSLTGTTLASATLVSAGSGYTSVPTVSLSGGGGSSGAVTAVLTGTGVASATITSTGSGTLGDMPVAGFSGGGGSGAAATVVVAGGIGSVTLVAGGSGYSDFFIVTVSGGGGSGAVVYGWATGGVILGFSIEVVGINYTSAPTLDLSAGGGTGGSGTASLAGGLTRFVIQSTFGPITTAPTVSFSGGGGSGAAGGIKIHSGFPYGYISNPGTGYASAPTPAFTGGSFTVPTYLTTRPNAIISSITITSSGSGYTTLPAVSITAAGLTSATATATLTATTLASLTLTNAGTGYTSAPTLFFQLGAGSGATGTTAITATTVASIAVTAAGSGYTSSPTVSFTGGGGGSGATATSALTAGTVASVTVTGAGSGYTSAPTIGFSGGGGTDATATATITGTSVASLTVANGGSGYTSTPTLSLSGGGGSGAVGNAVLTGTTIASITLGAGGSGYSSVPTLVFTGGGGSGASGSVSTSGVTLTGFTVTAAGSGYTSTPTVSLSGGGGTGAIGTATLTGTTIASFTVTSAGSGYTSAPTLSLTGGGGGGGASGTVTLTTAGVDSLTITNAGSGYTSAPTLSFSGGGGTGAAATAAIATSTVLEVTITAAGTGFTSAPTVGFSGGGGTGAAAVAPAGVGLVTLISANQRKEAGYDVYDYTWALGVGEIEASTRYNQSSDEGTTGATITTYRYITSLSASDPTTAPAATVKVSSTHALQDGYKVWTVVYAKGTGEVSRSLDYSQSSDEGVTGLKRTTISYLTASTQATRLPATLAGSICISQDYAEQDGHRVWTTTWAAGTGVISERYQQRPGGLRLVTWVSLGQAYDSAYMLPTGVLLAKDSDDRDGHTVWTVTTMQLAAGGADPTSGTAHSFTTMHPFRYPGRAKAITTTITFSGTTKYCYDVYKSPPVDLLVDATVTITYQVSNALGTVSPTLWNPDNWATVIAKYWAWSAYPKAVVETLMGYRSVSETPITFNGGSGGGGEQTCLGDRVYGLGSGAPYSLTVFGGPANPDNTNYSLAAELDAEPAFVAYDGTKYYRKTVISATIPPQTALPV
jgi:hypothetical protein